MRIKDRENTISRRKTIIVKVCLAPGNLVSVESATKSGTFDDTCFPIAKTMNQWGLLENLREVFMCYSYLKSV